jgi:predicted permease
MRESWAKLRAIFLRRRLDADLREEMDAHFQMELDEHLERGLSPGDALHVARRAFGNDARIRESSREAWMFIRLETLWQDIRYALRVLRRSRGFALTAMFVMTLGIGATTAAFTLLDYVLLRPLPFVEPERLVVLHQTNLADGGSRELVSPPNLIDWRTMSQSFGSMGAYISAFLPVNLSGHGTPQRLDTTLADGELFRTLGVQPAAGRLFTDEETRVDGANVVVLSHGLAMSLFGTPVDAIGRTLSLDNRAHTVVGVMPPGFAFPRADTALWRPLAVSSPGLQQSRSNHVLFAAARLNAGVSIEQARSEMDLIAEQLQQAYPKDNAKTGIAVVGLRGLLSPESRTLVVAVFAAALCLLLIACTNLANLLYARAMAREHEVQVRVAVGAARGRVLCQLLTENLMLAMLGGVLGAVLAVSASPLLTRLVPIGLPITGTPDIDLRVLVFTIIVTLSTTIVFGIGPAWRLSRLADLGALRLRSTGGSQTQRLRSALVLAEVTGTVILLVGAGLLVKALWRVQAIDPGYRTHGVLTLRTALPMPKYGDAAARRDFYTRVLGETRKLPGVTSAAYASYQPMEAFSGGFTVVVPGLADDPQTAPSAVVHFVTPDFFSTLGISVQNGRTMTAADDAESQPVVMISGSLADAFWPGRDPIGQRITAGRAGDRTVVGVVENIAVRSLEGAGRYGRHQIYFPFDQLGRTNAYYAPKDLLVHTSGDPISLVPALRTIVHDVDPEQAISNVRLLQDIVAYQTAPRRDQVLVLSIFSAIAFLLSMTGIYGLLAFIVAIRTRELGVRVALGAARSDILGMFLRQGLALGIGGVVLAIPLAYAAARGLGALLFGVNPGDPVIYGSSALLAMLMTLAGSLRPAIRASSINPALTIRGE